MKTSTLKSLTLFLTIKHVKKIIRAQNVIILIFIDILRIQNSVILSHKQTIECEILILVLFKF